MAYIAPHIYIYPIRDFLLILTLQYNKLTNEIPSSIFSLPSIFILELSNNNLSTNLSFSLGSNPQSIASMTFFSYMNLSYNNLSGQISLGKFNDQSIYVDNPDLGGDPLPTNCSPLVHGNGDKDKDHEDGADKDDEKIESCGAHYMFLVSVCQFGVKEVAETCIFQVSV
ncbi:Protein BRASSINOSTEROID INSENSITIVE 1, partial [Mucuna pruriens]